MKYAHILSYVASTPWAIHEDKLQTILSVLAFRAAGHVFTAEEIKAQIGDAQPPEPAKRGAVAVIPLRGVIAHRMGTMAESSGGLSAERFTKTIQAAAADPQIGSIVLDVDSPGGTITGVPEAAAAVFQARESKRIVAVANGMMASAAYWIASQAHEIVALPSIYDPAIGSIGVMLVHQDLSEHLAKEGVKTTILRTGTRKSALNPFEPLSDDAKAALEASMQAAFKQFVKDVERGRGIAAADIRALEGEAFNAQTAKAAGLVDKIATFDETINRLVGRKASSRMRAEDADVPLVAATDLDRVQRLRLL